MASSDADKLFNGVDSDVLTFHAIIRYGGKMNKSSVIDTKVVASTRCKTIASKDTNISSDSNTKRV